jgi:hypothetical protein
MLGLVSGHQREEVQEDSESEKESPDSEEENERDGTCHGSDHTGAADPIWQVRHACVTHCVGEAREPEDLMKPSGTRRA